MKKKSIIYYAALLLVLLATSCVKVQPKFNSNNLTVTFNAPTATYLTADKTVNGKDSLDFSYSGSCTSPITYVTLTKNDTEIGRDSIKTGDRMSFSNLIKKIVADTIPGNYVYKVVARDQDAVYLGASNPITVTVNSNFYYYTNRQMFVPDTTAKTNPCYYSSSLNSSFSYTSSGATNSAAIDFGFFFNTDSVYATKAKPATGVVGPTIYALNLTPTPSQISFNDISTWTKNATMLKVSGSPSFASLTSGGAIKQGVITNLKSGATNRVPVVTTTGTGTGTGGTRVDSYTALAAGNIIWFETADGRYGAISITYLNLNGAAKTTYMNFEVKLAN